MPSEKYNNEGVTTEIKKYLHNQLKFNVFMVYRIFGYQAPLKNVPFILEQSTIGDLLGFEEKISIQNEMFFYLN
jgi:hypothetical protein